MEDTNRHPLSDHDEFLAAITVQVVPRCVRDHADVLQVGTDLDRLVLEVTPPIVQEDVASWRLRITSGYDVASDEQVGPAVSIDVGRCHRAGAGKHPRQGMLGPGEVSFAVVYIEPILQGSIIGIEGAVPATGHI